MRDRTAFIVSVILHVGLLLFFTISIRANYKLANLSTESITITFQDQEPAPTSKPEPPKPEPTKPKPEPTQPEPTRPKPVPTQKVSDDTIKNIMDALNTPTPSPKATPKKTPTPKPTSAPKPTQTPKAASTPTPASAIPTPAITRIPLTGMQKNSSSVISPVTAEFSIQGSDSTDFSVYGMILARQIRNAWDIPRVLGPKRQEYITVASFTVAKDGTISEIEITSSSGWPIMDESVLKALQKASPVEALPFGYSAGSVRVTAPFIRPLE